MNLSIQPSPAAFSGRLGSGWPAYSRKVIMLSNNLMMQRGIEFLFNEKNDRCQLIGSSDIENALLLAEEFQPEWLIVETPGLLSSTLAIIDFCHRVHLSCPDVKLLMMLKHAPPDLLARQHTLGITVLITTIERLEVIRHALFCPLGSSFTSAALIKSTRHWDKRRMIKHPLTEKELSVIKELLAGGTLTEMACREGKSIKTLSSQKLKAMKKLGISTMLDLLNFRHAL